jgi:hypothetical protein
LLPSSVEGGTVDDLSRSKSGRDKLPGFLWIWIATQLIGLSAVTFFTPLPSVFDRSFLVLVFAASLVMMAALAYGLWRGWKVAWVLALLIIAASLQRSLAIIMGASGAWDRHADLSAFVIVWSLVDLVVLLSVSARHWFGMTSGRTQSRSAA